MKKKNRHLMYIISFMMIFLLFVFIGSLFGYLISEEVSQKTYYGRGEGVAEQYQHITDDYTEGKAIFLRTVAAGIELNPEALNVNTERYLSRLTELAPEGIKRIYFVKNENADAPTDENSVVFGGAYYDSAAGGYMMRADYTIIIDGKTEGVLCVEFSVDEITDLLKNAELPDDCYLFAVDSEDNLVVHRSVTGNDTVGITLIRKTLYSQLRSNMRYYYSGSVSGTDYDGTERNMFYSKSGNNALCVVAATVPSAWAIEQSGYVACFIVIIVCMSIILCIVGFFLFRKMFIEPIDDAESASRAKSDFLSGMSHEIRTPINAILGMDELILRKSESDDITDYALNIQSAGRTLLQLIGDILDFSKIEAGKLQLNEEEYDLAVMLNDIRIVLAPRAEEKNLNINIVVAHDIPTKIKGDEFRVKQILTNILTNAIKYTEKGSIRFKVTWERTGADTMTLICSVKDTGIGIKPEDKERLFSSFQRLEENKHRSIEGVGLGMSITKQLVTLMRGEITVESEYDVGSEFVVYIPQIIVSMTPMGDFAATYMTKQRVRKEYKESFTAPEANILVVDDNAVNLKIVSLLLKKTQMNIDTAENGAKCLEMVKQKKYDIILMDHMMPDLDGIQTLKKLETMHDNMSAEAHVIVLTANAVSGSRELYIEQGFSDYLSKPIKYAKLEAMLKLYLPKNLVKG